MSDLPQQNTIVQYLADGITTQYVVPFFTPLETDGTPDLDVYTQLASAAPVPATDINEWNVAYTYTPNLDPTTGGVITFQPGFIPPNGYAVTIVRDVSASLDVEFANAQNFSGITLDAALQKLLLITQQNKSYALGRNLSYIVNSYLPEATIMANVQIPVLQPGQVWFGAMTGGVIAATLEQSTDVSTLRSELANNQPVTNGAALVGYYDPENLNPTTVADQLTLLTEAIVDPFPPGSIVDFGGTVAPSGFLLCNGQAVSRATYANLFSAIGTIWGIGDGSTTFNVPNLNGIVTAGSGGHLFTTPGVDTVGLTGGGATVSLTADNLPQHTHASPAGKQFVYNAGVGTLTFSGAGAVNFQTGSATGNNTTAHTGVSVVQPTAIVLKIIKI